MMHSKGVRNTYLYLLVLLIALTLFSCFEEVKMPPSSDPPPKGKNEKGLYIGGTAMNENGVPVASYWKDGVPINLSATYQDAVFYNSVGFGLTMSGNDVYVCGVLYTSKGNIPTYWKNGQAVILTPGTGQATGIAVVGTNVYVCGVLQSDNGNNYGVVWKNGVISYLTEGTTFSSANTLIVSGQNVHVGGYLYQDGKTYATYWKNGNPLLLTSGDNFAHVESLAIAGNTVYAAGRELGNDVGKYWKDGQVVNLTDPSSSQVIISVVYTKGHDVYAAGKRRNGTSWDFVAWKNNNIIFTTPMGGIDIQISGLSVVQDNLIATGNVVYAYPNSSVYAHATIWTNGEPETLAQGADETNVYFANSIVAKH
jgi:hypothetical protein